MTDGLTVEEAAEPVVASRRALTAATHRVDAAEQVLRETPADIPLPARSGCDTGTCRNAAGDMR